MKVIALLLALFGCLSLVSASVRAAPPSGNYNSATIYLVSSNTYNYVDGIIDADNGVAWGFFNDTIEATGWGHLVIHTSPAFSDYDQAYAAGYLEGALTGYRIAQHYQNLMSSFGFNDGVLPIPIIEFFENQYAWFTGSIANATYDPENIWSQFGAINAQFEGLVAGYAFTNEQPLTLIQLLALNSAGDLLDIIPALNVTNPNALFELQTDKLLDLIAKRSHCSFTAKILGDYSDLYFSHTTWFSYSWMLRVFKEYNISLSTSVASGVLFSSYPGALTSIDDFYFLSSGLLVSETTNDILNLTIYENVTPSSVLSWQRVLLANRIAVDSPSWADYFSLYNSGTYNNQWIVLNYNLFTPGEPLMDDTLWIIEQIPGLVVAEDETDILRFGYWPSYNVPFFPAILDKSGWTYEYMTTKDTSFTHELAPRAQIFRRDQGSVVDLATYQALMRENNYATDPYSDGDPGQAIAARFDLRTSNAFAAGAIDTKIVSYDLFLNGQVLALSGPTVGDGSLPPFSWDDWYGSDSHVGQPTIFNFEWQTFQPTTF